MKVQVIHSITQLREQLARVRSAGKTIGLVPTMGALHAGHGRLIDEAARKSDCAVVSVFVNSIQFNDQKDYDLYPRTLDADAAFCEARGAHIVFAPSAEEMYPQPPRSFVDVGGLTDHLCGTFRPGHFRGVATVVMKLFAIVQPDYAFFGEKDAQQLAVIRRMVKDLNVPVSIAGVATVREADGLALSSRNRRLRAGERKLAPLFYQALRLVEERIAGGVSVPSDAKAAALSLLSRPGIRVEYLEIVDPEELQPVRSIDGPVLVAGAIWLGAVRLIDNILCRPAV